MKTFMLCLIFGIEPSMSVPSLYVFESKEACEKALAAIQDISTHEHSPAHIIMSGCVESSEQEQTTK